MQSILRLTVLLCLLSGTLLAAERPNVLWITSEDNSPYLGCYGDPQAKTPRLDQLAAEGVRYRHAFANAPVCSTARSTLITGMYACSLGVHHHRSRVAVPTGFRMYPEYLRQAGYYCTNNSKTDYNVANVGEPWDESSNKAHYRNRGRNQPFFAVFNLTTSHESQVAPKAGKVSFRLAPQEVVLPPYHPDTPELRRDWANYYDQLAQLDEQIGALLDELERAGLADDTIVFYYSDHGGALPRGKRNIHDSGTRVPLIVRFPSKWAHLSPGQPGDWIEQPVSFVDLPATLLSVCGVPIPKQFEGRAFLGAQRGPDREFVFLYRGRMDERYDHVRAIRDREYRYIQNYSPHRPWGQHYSYPFQVMPGMGSWYTAYRAGRCNADQARYWQPKPSEELYRLSDDPFELNNLVEDAAQTERLARMRAQLREEMLATRDTGFIPEGMFERLAGGGTLYEYAHSDRYPLAAVTELADKAASRDARELPALQAALRHEEPLLRYWGAIGCLVLQEKAAPARERLVTALSDECADVRVAAAEALGYLGRAEAGFEALRGVVGTGNLYEKLAALNALDFMVAAGHLPLEQVQEAVRPLKLEEPADRIPRYLLSLP